MAQPTPSDAIDPRTPLMALRRHDLIKIIEHFDIPADINAPGDSLRIIVRDAIESKKLKFKIIPPPKNRLGESARLILPKKTEEFSNMDKFAMIRMLRGKGIEASDKETRAQLIEKLNG